MTYTPVYAILCGMIETKGEMNMRKNGKIRAYVPTAFLISLGIFLISGVLYLLAINNARIADLLNDSIGTAVRFVLARLTGWLPFSLFELLIICILPLTVILVIYLVRTRRTAREIIKSVLAIFSVIVLILSSYVFTLGIGYRTTSLSQKTGIAEVRDIEREELLSVTNLLIREVNSLASRFDVQNGETVMPYTLSGLCDRLCVSFTALNEKYGLPDSFSGGVKPVLFSTVMSDTGITGIYSFFTCEANVNVEYPHYTLAFTAAHEMAHQRGIARENEANFVAFLVCIESDDDYIRYSGYLGMLEYFLSAAYATDREGYPDLFATISDIAVSDMRAASALTMAHSDSLIGKISDRLNDRYLKFNGTDGVVSYGYAVRLAVGYYRNDS